MKQYVIRGTARYADGDDGVIAFTVDGLEFVDGAKDAVCTVLFHRLCERDGFEPIEFMEAEQV